MGGDVLKIFLDMNSLCVLFSDDMIVMPDNKKQKSVERVQYGNNTGSNKTLMAATTCHKV